MAIITPALGAARASLNRRFPGRDKASDGWIGDAAHRGTRSGHNPDETGNAEYQDSDNLDEVRAVDLDKDLRHPTLTMHDVVRAILATPADRDRCSYLIYDRTIWSRSAGYAPRVYTGSNPHTSHLHISGRPTNDADDRPWLSIERLDEEDDMATAAEVWDYNIPPGADIDEYSDDTSWRALSILRSTQTWAYRATKEARKSRAENAAILAKLGGEDVTAAVKATIRAEFATLGPALAAELADVPAERVEAAIRAVLGSLDES